jgi:osmoprotectant transport system substrate-binding protein
VLVVVVLAAGCQGKTPSGTATSPGASTTPPGPAIPLPSTTVPPVKATRGPLAVASAGYTESEVMAALYAALLTHAGFDVSTSAIPNVDQLQTALEKGDADLVPQPLATYTDQLNRQVRGADAKPVASGDLAATLAQLAPLAASRGVTALRPAKAVDELAFAVGRKFAARNSLRTLSDLGRSGISVRLAAGAECATSRSCKPGLLRTYGITVSEVDPLGVDTLAAKNAVARGTDQVAAVLTTDNTLGDLKLLALVDDKHLQPAGNLVPIANSKTLALHPEVAGVLDKLADVLTTDDVARLITAVDVARQRPGDVANAYLVSKGLL